MALLQVQGLNSNVTTEADLCETAIARIDEEPSTGVATNVVSASANDAAAGSGIRTILVDGIDSNDARAVTVVTLNGLTPVAIASPTFKKINFMSALTYGGAAPSHMAAAGDITIKNGGATKTYGVIKTGMSKSRNGRFTAPANAPAKLLAIDWGSSTQTNVAAFVYGDFNPNTGQVHPGKYVELVQIVFRAASFRQELSNPITIPPGCSVKLAASAGAAAMIHGVMHIDCPNYFALATIADEGNT